MEIKQILFCIGILGFLIGCLGAVIGDVRFGLGGCIIGTIFIMLSSWIMPERMRTMEEEEAYWCGKADEEGRLAARRDERERRVR